MTNSNGVFVTESEMIQARAFNEGLRMLISLHAQIAGVRPDLLCSTLAHSIGTLSAALDATDEDSFDSVVLANVQVGRVSQRQYARRNTPSAGSA